MEFTQPTDPTKGEIDMSLTIGKISKASGLNDIEINYKDLNQDYKIEEQIDDVLTKMKEIDRDNKFD